MKTHYFLILLLCIIANNLNAQWINSLTVSPANPTTADSIFVYAQCSFPSGSCDQKAQTLYISPGYIYGQATHCLGMLTYICDATDTFKIVPLPGGNYKFLFSLTAGSLPYPCIPGFGPGVTDSVSFTVTDVNSIPEVDKDLFQFNLFPNPVKDQLQITFINASAKPGNVTLTIYDLNGKQVLLSEIMNKETTVDVSSFTPGVYLCRLAGEKINEKHLIEVKR